MNKPPSSRVFAAVYACSERSIRNYRQEGAPLDDPAAMFAWWATRKNMPRSVATKGLEAIQAAFDAVIARSGTSSGTGVDTPATTNEPQMVSMMQDDLPAGAEHELRWLADLAVEARRNLIRAHRGGNPVVQKQALDSYLKITEGLRKFDNQVTTERRDSGETVTRAQIESVLLGVIVWTRRGIANFVNTVCIQLIECDRPEQVWTIIEKEFHDSLCRALDASMESQSNVPQWMREAMVAGLSITR